MRPLITAFLILSPFIAIAQNYDVQHLPATHIVHAVANVASMKVSTVVHAVQALFA